MNDMGSTYIVRIDDAPNHWGQPCYCEKWSLPGEKYAGPDRPSDVVRVAKTGQVVRMIYLNLEGDLDRKDGPADISFNPDGSVADQGYFLNGIRQSPPSETNDYTPEM